MRARVALEQHQRQVLQHDRDAERHEQDVLVVAVAGAADHAALQRVAEREHRRHHDRQRQVRVDAEETLQAVDAVQRHHQRRAVREVDDVQHAVDQRQAERHQRVDRAGGDAVEQRREEDVEAHVACAMPRLSAAKPRAGVRRRSDAAAPRCARGSLRCSIAWPAEKLAPLPAVVALEQSRRVRTRSALTRAATRSALLGAAYVAADAHPPTALPARWWHAWREHHEWCCAVGGARWRRLVGRREAQQRGRRAYSRASFI